MAKRPYRWKWTATIEPESLIELQKLAVNLGYIVDVPGGFQGNPSPAAMLDALAAAYRADSGAVIDAMREIGVVLKNAADIPLYPPDQSE
jgi:hypothetical protein